MRGWQVLVRSASGSGVTVAIVASFGVARVRADNPPVQRLEGRVYLTHRAPRIACPLRHGERLTLWFTDSG